MAIDPASFKVRFPEFVSESDPRIQLFIDDSVIILNETYWGTKYDLGLYYLTAHFLTLGNESEAGSNGSVGPVTSQTVDGTSLSFGIASSDNEWKNYLGSTIYGQRYLVFVKTLGIPAYVI